MAPNFYWEINFHFAQLALHHHFKTQQSQGLPFLSLPTCLSYVVIITANPCDHTSHKFNLWCWYYYFLGAFTKQCKSDYELHHVCTSVLFVCLHGTTWLPLDRILLNTILRSFTKTVNICQFLLKLDKHNTYFTLIPTHIHPTSSLTTFGDNKRKLWSIVDIMLRYGENIAHPKNKRKLCLIVNVPKKKRYNVHYVTHFKHSDFYIFFWYHLQIWNLQTITKWMHQRCWFWEHFVLSVNWSAINQILMKMLACNKIITICNLPTIILRKYLKELKIKNCLGQLQKALLLYTDSNRKKWVWINKYIHTHIHTYTYETD